MKKITIKFIEHFSKPPILTKVEDTNIIKITIEHPICPLSKKSKKKRYSKLTATIEGEAILIGYIESFYENRGFGGKMLTKLINYAKENNYKAITGNLNGNDEKLFYFYTKYGFQILSNEDSCFPYKILLEINLM